MKTQTILRVSLIAALLLNVSFATGNRSTKARLTPTETKALIQAIMDEIYDYEYQGHYFPQGSSVGELISESKTRVPLYIEPSLEQGEGRAIYKLMPYGEVLRLFHVHSDGTVVLDGDPEIGFPATHPNTKTVYIKDSEVARIKRDWIKSSFEVDISPSTESLRAVVIRQKQRTGGFSAWESARSEGEKNRAKQK